MLLVCWVDPFMAGKRLIDFTAAVPVGVLLAEVGNGGGVAVEEGKRLGRGVAGRGWLPIFEFVV